MFGIFVYSYFDKHQLIIIIIIHVFALLLEKPKLLDTTRLLI